MDPWQVEGVFFEFFCLLVVWFFLILLSYICSMCLGVHPTIQIHCVPKKHLNSMYICIFDISCYSQRSSLNTHLWRSCGALQTSISQVAWPVRNLGDIVKFSGGKVQELYLFLSLSLLLYRAVIVNCFRVLSYCGILSILWRSTNHRVLWFLRITK